MDNTPTLQFNSLAELTQAVNEAVQGFDRAEAFRLSGYIRHELQQQGGQLVSEPNGALQLADMLVRLSYVRFVGLSDSQATALLKDHLPAAFSIPGFILTDAVYERLDLYEQIPERIAFEQQALGVLQKHTAVLGDATITIGTRQVEATIGNWLTDYENFPSKAQRDELDVLNYLNKSANVRKLSEPERKILLSILEMYDRLKQDIYVWNSVPEPQSEAEAFKDFDLYAELPDIDYDPNERAQTAPTTASHAVTPRPTNKIVAPVTDHDFAPAPLATPKPEPVAQSAPTPTAPVTPVVPEPVAPSAPYQEDPIRPHRVINRPDLPETSSDAAETQKEILANIQVAKAQGLVSAKLPPVAPLPHPDVVPTKLDDLRKRIQP